MLDTADPLAHRHYLYGASGKDYIGNQRLAWEFLRRSQIYRQDIAAFMERWQAILPGEATHPDRPGFTEEYDAPLRQVVAGNIPRPDPSRQYPTAAVS